jgi:hypothetical protein
MTPVQRAALAEAEKLLAHLAAFIDRHGLLVPELVVTLPGGVEARLSLKRLAPAPEGEHL